MAKWETVEDIEADLRAAAEAARLARQRPKPPAPVLTVASDRKLSVAGQRERVAREVKELVEAEKTAPREDYHKLKREQDRQAGLYYRQLYEATATAEYWATQRDDDDARHGRYDPVARFEREDR
jgi:hypothetical protein